MFAYADTVFLETAFCRAVLFLGVNEMRIRWVPLTFLFIIACSKDREPSSRGSEADAGTVFARSAEPSRAADAGSQESPTVDATPVKTEVSPESLQDPVYECAAGVCRWTERRDAEKKGLSFIDLRDDFAPMIFSEQTPGRDDASPNPYRKTYLNLAQDKTDEDGNPLKEGEHNYLELYGIMPTLGVLQTRFARSTTHPCSAQIDYAKFRGLKGFIQWVPGNHAKYKKRYEAARSAFFSWAKKRRIPDPDAWIADPANTKKPDVVMAYIHAKNLYDGLLELKKRLECEEIVKPGELKDGIFDEAMHKAIRRFERKHRIYGWGFVNDKMQPYLNATLLENDHQALTRVLTERVAHSLAIFEDGSVRLDGKPAPGRPRDLIGDLTKKLMADMGVETPEKAAAFFARHRPENFRYMVAAVALPPLPEYYSEHMDFEVKINIGDVWYDFPYNPDGTRKEQPGGQLPYLHFYVRYKGELIPLARLGTTAGGWQYELKEKQVFMKYKGSDLGPREWKYIVGAPVWFPPESTPPNELAEFANVNGQWVPRVKWKQLGPSYASAYGLAMAIHSILRKRPDGSVEEWDNGIRTHGSVNYMSILYGTSHGCHRLHNHLAVRLFSNILKRRHFVRKGQQPAQWRHIFSYGGKTHVVDLNTKGYYFELTPPIPVMVTRAGILGKQQTPIPDVIRVPGKAYPQDLEIGLELSEDGSLQPAAPAVSPDAGTQDENSAPSGDGETDSNLKRLPPPPDMAPPAPDGKNPTVIPNPMPPARKP